MTVTPELEAIRAQTRETLGAVLAGVDRVAVVDFPNHQNAGDHLIFVGTLEYLRELGVEISYLADMSRYDKSDLDHFAPDVPLLIQGGGNFGDRWVEIQNFRERVVAENHDRRIIQLPQSIEFSPGPRLEGAQAVLGAHPDLTLMIRDTGGAALTADLFPTANVLYCPDLALGAKIKANARDASKSVMCLRRGDSESTGGLTPPPGAAVSDWGLKYLDHLLYVLLRLPGAVGRRSARARRILYPVQRHAYIAMANLNVRSATRILGRGRVLVTDRLHAAVLGALMGMPVIAQDNANHKISAIFTDYVGTLPGVFLASDQAAIEERLSLLLDW